MELDTGKLQWDLQILTAMVADMDAYLRSDMLYWPLANRDMPKLTLGGYLLRQHRLIRLRDLLKPAEVKAVDAAVEQFQQILTEKIVRSEARAHEELGVRVRQWGAYLTDVRRAGAAQVLNYETAVDNRAIVEALRLFLLEPPYQFDPESTQNLAMLDKGLATRWQAGAFVWPEAWAPAYPQADYWWLYGRPK